MGRATLRVEYFGGDEVLGGLRGMGFMKEGEGVSNSEPSRNLHLLKNLVESNTWKLVNRMTLREIYSALGFTCL